MPSADSNPRVVVTSHTRDGTSVFASDRELPLFQPFGPTGSSFCVFDARGAVPVNNLDPLATANDTLPRCPPNGLNFCISNIAAGTTVPMHRTHSLDYAVVLSGEIVLALDNGQEKTVQAGEFIVQCGTNHSWANRTEDTCRLAFVCASAAAIKLEDGRELEETVITRPA